MRSQRGQYIGSGSGDFLLRLLFGTAEGGGIDDWPDDRFAASLAALYGGLSLERGDERSDPESAISCVNDFRNAVAKASYVVGGLKGLSEMAAV